MQHVFSVFDNGSLLFVRHNGAFGVADIRAFRRALIADPAFQIRHTFVDLSGLEMVDFSAADVLGHAMDVQDGYDSDPVAAKQVIYAPEDSPGFPMARMFEGMADSMAGFEARVFSDPDNGLAWLKAAYNYAHYIGTENWNTF